MTPQEHIEAIGRGLALIQGANKAMRKALEQSEKSETLLHARLERAQKAYMATREGRNIVAFSGGTNKPPVDDPDKPVKP